MMNDLKDEPAATELAMDAAELADAEMIAQQASQLVEDLFKVIIQKVEKDLIQDPKSENIVQHAAPLGNYAAEMLIDRAESMAKMSSCRTGDVSYMLTHLAQNVAKILSDPSGDVARLTSGTSEVVALLVKGVAQESAKMLFRVYKDIPETGCHDEL